MRFYINLAKLKRLIPFIVFAAAWQFLVFLTKVDEQVFPGPLIVLKSFWELLANGELLRHSVASLYRVTIGFYLAAILGISFGILMGMQDTTRKFFNPLLQFMRPISPLAWIPLAMLWFGIGDAPAIFLIFLASFFPLVMSTMVAVESINPTYFKVAAIFDFNNREKLVKIVLPAIIPDIVTALRLTIGIAWLVVVAAEMIAVQSGLGYLVLDSRNALRIDYVLVSMVVIGCVGVVLDWLMQLMATSNALDWKRSER